MRGTGYPSFRARSTFDDWGTQNPFPLFPGSKLSECPSRRKGFWRRIMCSRFFLFGKRERAMGLEPTTPGLGSRYSTIELCPLTLPDREFGPEERVYIAALGHCCQPRQGPRALPGDQVPQYPTAYTIAGGCRGRGSRRGPKSTWGSFPAVSAHGNSWADAPGSCRRIMFRGTRLRITLKASTESPPGGISIERKEGLRAPSSHTTVRSVRYYGEQ